ncbi:hypothetical protein [Carnobacterium sp.]|uniref:hypothetical protein n=1 Tax=Carnobacterium sp. TaxID=48221 RepID=UPI00388F196E
MIGKFSINILLQSFNQIDKTPRESFENKIVLYNFEEEINNSNLKELIYKSNYELPYKAADETVVYWEVVKIIDIFEIDSEMTFTNNAEVYSRFFIDQGPKEEILTTFFLDYVWED